MVCEAAKGKQKQITWTEGFSILKSVTKTFVVFVPNTTKV